MRDLCIIGGGASAMAAAITAARENPELKICILEKKSSLGKKLAATGNGKCNLTNAACPGVRQTLDFFSSIGIVTRTEEQGRIYPYSQQAADVVYGMARQLTALGVEIKTDCAVDRIAKTQGGFMISCSNKEQLCARKVLLATGGKAAPQFGTTGDGYTLARGMGHTVTRLAPVLTGLDTDTDFRLLKGVRMRAAVGLERDGILLSREEGEVQFTADGLSGICIFDLSRFIKFEETEPFQEGIKRYRILLDFLPHMSLPQVCDFLQERCDLVGLRAEELFLSILPENLAKFLFRLSGIADSVWSWELNKEQVRMLAELLKGWELGLKGVKGWKNAQCTSGGVKLAEIDPETMESRIVPGFYFSGEIIDYDGPCGGFNLQNAWETGIKAGKAMAVSL